MEKICIVENYSGDGTGRSRMLLKTPTQYFQPPMFSFRKRSGGPFRGWDVNESLEFPGSASQHYRSSNKFSWAVRQWRSQSHQRLWGLCFQTAAVPSLCFAFFAAKASLARRSKGSKSLMDRDSRRFPGQSQPSHRTLVKAGRGTEMLLSFGEKREVAESIPTSSCF